MEAMIIFNGIHFPYALLDKGLEWAKQHGAGIHVLYLTSDKEKNDSYAFPSDIDLTDTSFEIDAQADNARIIRSQAKLAKDSAAAENVSCKTEWLVNSTMDELIERTSSAAMIFLDGAVPEPPAILSNENIDMQTLAKKISVPAQFVASY